MFLYIFIILLPVVSYLLIRRKRYRTLNNEHCLITGGSSGIGLALAIQVARLGANVTIIARSKTRLEAAKDKISVEIKNENQKILTFSADICEQNNKLEEISKKAEKDSGPITLLINCAGTSICHPFLETPIEEFSRMVSVNYLGTIYTTRAVLPLMKERKQGTIVFVSSLAGLTGLYGYTAYSASKFALLGMAESLQMEVKPYNLNICVAFPPDTDTPGFAEELKNKPIETIKISESAGLFSAEEVAAKILYDALNKKFMSAIGLEGWILCTLCSGMSPITSILELVQQVLFMGLLRLISYFVLANYEGIIKNCAAQKKIQSSKEEKTIQ